MNRQAELLAKTDKLGIDLRKQFASDRTRSEQSDGERLAGKEESGMESTKSPTNILLEDDR